jgi:hypothetical protein
VRKKLEHPEPSRGDATELNAGEKKKTKSNEKKKKKTATFEFLTHREQIFVQWDERKK